MILDGLDECGCRRFDLEVAVEALQRASSHGVSLVVGKTHPPLQAANGPRNVVCADKARASLIDLTPDIDLVRDQSGKAARSASATPRAKFSWWEGRQNSSDA